MLFVSQLNASNTVHEERAEVVIYKYQYSDSKKQMQSGDLMENTVTTYSC